jgi:hypothetical protein
MNKFACHDSLPNLPITDGFKFMTEAMASIMTCYTYKKIMITIIQVKKTIDLRIGN